jgi:hypothetical protein
MSTDKVRIPRESGTTQGEPTASRGFSGGEVAATPPNMWPVPDVPTPQSQAQGGEGGGQTAKPES